MRICREYEFPQDKTSVSHAVEEGINTLLRLNCSEDCIVDLYLVALLASYTVLTREQKEWLAEQSPLLFRRARISKDQRQIPYAKCNEEIAKVQESWQMIEPLSFLEQYQAYLYHKKNDSGLENGMISTRLLFNVKDNMKLLIVDPSPSFLRHLEQEEKIKQLKITVAFTNNRYAQVYSCHELPSHIWNLYLQDNRTMQNPVSDIFAEIADRRDAEYDMRNALALRSLTVKQMRLLLEYLKNDCTDPIMALLVKCKLFLGIGSGAIAALTIGDYYKIPGYDLQVLNVTKSIPQTGNQPQPFVRPWQNVLVPVTTGIAKELDDLVSATKNELLLSGVPEKNFGEYPLFHSSDLKEPIRTRRINEYCAELLSKLEIPEIVLNNPDDGIESDIGQYHRDLLMSNWKMQAARIAEMDRAAICYLSGTRQKTVTNNNYRDFSHPLQLKKLKVNLEKLQTKIEQALPLPDKKCIYMSLSDNMRKTVTYAPQTTATEIVIELQMKESNRVELELDALHGCIMSIEYLEDK